MKYELRNIKTLEALSRETQCFAATIYRDGKRWARVSNDGGGGSDRIEVFDVHRSGWAKELSAFNEWCALEIGVPVESGYSSEMWVAKQMDAIMTERKLKRLIAGTVKNGPAWRYEGGEPGAYHTIKGKHPKMTLEELAATIRHWHKSNPKHDITKVTEVLWRGLVWNVDLLTKVGFFKV